MHGLDRKWNWTVSLLILSVVNEKTIYNLEKLLKLLILDQYSGFIMNALWKSNMALSSCWMWSQRYHIIGYQYLLTKTFPQSIFSSSLHLCSFMSRHLNFYSNANSCTLWGWCYSICLFLWNLGHCHTKKKVTMRKYTSWHILPLCHRLNATNCTDLVQALSQIHWSNTKCQSKQLGYNNAMDAIGPLSKFDNLFCHVLWWALVSLMF